MVVKLYDFPYIPDSRTYRAVSAALTYAEITGHPRTACSIYAHKFGADELVVWEFVRHILKKGGGEK